MATMNHLSESERTRQSRISLGLDPETCLPMDTNEQTIRILLTDIPRATPLVTELQADLDQCGPETPLRMTYAKLVDLILQDQRIQAEDRRRVDAMAAAAEHCKV